MKRLISFFIFLLSTINFFAATDISLLDKGEKSGMTIYWDPLSESGMIEKNGHQLLFRKGEQIVLLDSMKMMVTDAPELRDNKIFVSKKFLDDSEEFFNQKSELPFKDNHHKRKRYKFKSRKTSRREASVKLSAKTNNFNAQFRCLFVSWRAH